MVDCFLKRQLFMLRQHSLVNPWISHSIYIIWSWRKRTSLFSEYILAFHFLILTVMSEIWLKRVCLRLKRSRIDRIFFFYLHFLFYFLKNIVNNISITLFLRWSWRCWNFVILYLSNFFVDIVSILWRRNLLIVILNIFWLLINARFSCICTV